MLNIFDPILNTLHRAVHAVTFTGKNKDIEWTYKINFNTEITTLSKMVWTHDSKLGYRVAVAERIEFDTIQKAIDFLEELKKEL